MPGDFLTSNEYRDYPFLHPVQTLLVRSDTRQFPLPQDLIVEAQVSLGAECRYHPVEHVVYLLKISLTGSTLTITLATTAPGANGLILNFNRHVNDREFTVSKATAVDLHTGLPPTPPSGQVTSPPFMTGTLVTGQLADTLALLTSGQYLTGATSIVLEPSLVGQLPPYVRSISTTNAKRLMAGSWNCADPDAPSYILLPYPMTMPMPCVIDQTGIQGEISFLAGYNVTLSEPSGGKQITIGGRIGAGLGQPSGEVPLTPGEQPPDGSAFLDGGPGCGALVTSLAGLPGPNVDLKGGQGVSIYRHPFLRNRLVVDFHLSGLNLQNCASLPLVSSVAVSEQLPSL